MISRKVKYIPFLLLILLASSVQGYAQSSKEEKHLLVSLRMIGHQILLDSGDSTSRVFPIEKEGESYKIQFASAFAFDPANLASTINRLVDQTKIASSYIVEVKRCESDEVVYSYEKGDTVNSDLMPCATRFQSKACYVVFFTILKKYKLDVVGSLYQTTQIESPSIKKTSTISTITTTKSSPENKTKPTNPKNQNTYSMIALPIGSVFAFIGLVVYFKRKRQVSVPVINPSGDSETVWIGDTRFDQKNMVLLHGNEKIELSSKESDLLSLLYTNVNKTIERDYILKVVWGDEGDYIGRTLDVFVSKLRKKLEVDSRVKIVNIRGIGYKFIVN